MAQACLKQPRLAHARLTSQQHNPTGAVVRRGKRLIQRGLLALAPDQISVNLCHSVPLRPGDRPGAKHPPIRALRKYTVVADVCPDSSLEA